MRRCYAECCVQTHLTWHIEKGNAERVCERGRTLFAATSQGRESARREREERQSKDWS
jgi:hypothetical protein